MAASVTITDSGKQDFLNGQHNPTDVYKVALYSSVIGLNAGSTQYTSANEAIGMNYVAGGVVLTGRTVTLDQGSAILDFDDPVWLNSTISARGGMIYNASQGNRSLAVLDFDGLMSSQNGAFRLQFPPPTKATGLIKLS